MFVELGLDGSAFGKLKDGDEVQARGFPKAS
jgi:hypothetical protein